MRVLLAAPDSCCGALSYALPRSPPGLCIRAHQRTRCLGRRSSTAPRSPSPSAPPRSSECIAVVLDRTPFASAHRCVCPSSSLQAASFRCRCAFDPQPVSREGASPKAAQPPHFLRYAPAAGQRWYCRLAQSLSESPASPLSIAAPMQAPAAGQCLHCVRRLCPRSTTCRAEIEAARNSLSADSA